MNEAELERRGYYLFGVNQDMFVQVRSKKDDRVLVIGAGRKDALERAERLLAQGGEMNVLVGCYSTHPDGELTAVVIDVGTLFIRELEACRVTFSEAKKVNNKLDNMTYHDKRLRVPVVADDVWGLGEDLVLLSTALNEADREEEPELKAPTLPFLVVSQAAFHYSFVAENSLGNDIFYETNPFTADEIRKVLKL